MRELAYYEAKFEALDEIMAADDHFPPFHIAAQALSRRLAHLLRE